MPKITTEIQAIDPLAILLSNEVFVRINLPRPPELEVIVERIAPALQGISATERTQTLARAKALGAYAAAVEKALGGQAKS